MPLATTRLRLLVGSVVALLAVAGCQTLDDAGRAIGRADLVNELASRMDHAMELTYSAEYQITGGGTASIAQAQKPPRSAYVYPGGKLTVSKEVTAECDTAASPPTCTLSPPPAPGTRTTVTAFNGARQHGMVTPPVVINLLTAAALDQGAVIEQSDTTVAGHHATCVEVKEASSPDVVPFNACVTTEGVLGTFQGVVEGQAVEMALTRYQDSVDGKAFDLPAGAKVIDRRPAQR